ncbi:MAG: alkaline phosphatase family protein [Candidatus Woesearchaeota archaeon]
MYPDYTKSIVNIVSAIANKFEVSHRYKSLFDISQKKNVVLVAIDGLGFEWLQKYGKGSFLQTHVKDSVTSTFPSTTTVAMSTYLYGVPGQQTGLTGWYMYAKEFAGVITPLPFVSMIGSPLFVDREELFPSRTFAQTLPVSTWTIYPRDIIADEFRMKKDRFWHHGSFPDMVKKIKEATQDTNRQKFIFAYWSEFDILCHKHGIQSSKVKEHFHHMDAQISKLVHSLKDTTLIITADHGLINTPKSRMIDVSKDTKLSYCLTLPLTGEPRTAFAYVRAGMEKQFLHEMTKYNYACDVVKSSTLLKQQVFGLQKPHPRLHERIGDYCLIAKENYSFADVTVNEKKASVYRANHGGTSSWEMKVPFILIETE